MPAFPPKIHQDGVPRSLIVTSFSTGSQASTMDSVLRTGRHALGRLLYLFPEVSGAVEQVLGVKVSNGNGR